MAATDQEKTEAPTAKRRDDARQKGNVATSKEANSAAVLVASVAGFYFIGIYIYDSLTRIWIEAFTRTSSFRISVDNFYNFFNGVTSEVVKTIAPFMIIVSVAGLAVCLLQTGLLFTLQPIMPKLSKVSPLAGFKRLFSIKSLAELVKSILKVIIIAYTAYIVVGKHYPRAIRLIAMDPPEILAYIGKAMLELFFYTTLVFLVVAALDVIFQRQQHEKSLKMTKQEIKDEYKQREGDPMVRARIRGVQREIARRRMISDASTADVVITNPVHVAVALRYARGEMRAPLVVAKGAGFMAERIKEVARTHGIPIVEKRLLARMLFKLVDVGQEIPETMYKTVAELLAYVYKLKGKRAG